MQPTKFNCIYQANCEEIRLSQHGIESHDRIKSIQFGLNGRVRLINNSDKEFFIDIKGFLPPSYITEQQVKDLVAKHYFTASFSAGYFLNAFPIGPGGGQDYSTRKRDGTPIQLTEKEKSDLAAIMKESKNDIEKALVICASTEWERSTKFQQRVEQLKVLLKIGADPNATYQGNPVIFQTKHSSMFSLISKAGARWDVRNSKGESTFVHAVNIRYMEEAFCDLILKAYEGGHKNLILETQTDKLLVNLTDTFWGKKSLDCIKLLVEAGSSLETSFGGTPLAKLVKKVAENDSKDLKDAITFLCQAGANPNKTVTIYSHENYFHGTIIHIVLSAVRYRLLNKYSVNIEASKECAIELLNAKIKVDLKQKDSLGLGPLFRAAQLGWYDIFCLMLENGADPNETHPTEGPILFSVTEPRYLEYLIKNKADLSLKNPKEESIVQRIIQQPSLASATVIDQLIEQKVIFGTFDSELLFSFLKSRHPELPIIVEKLLTGININDCNTEAHSPLSFFLNECLHNSDWKANTKAILNLLLNAKADIKKIPASLYMILPLEIKQLLQSYLINDEHFLTFVSDISVKIIAGLSLSYSAIESHKKIDDVKNLVVTALKTCLGIAIFWDAGSSEVLSIKGEFISFLSVSLDNFLSKSIFFNPTTGVIDSTVSLNFQEDMSFWLATIETEYLKIRSEEEIRIAQQKLENELSKSRQLIEKVAQEEKQKLARELEEKAKAVSAVALPDEYILAAQYNRYRSNMLHLNQLRQDDIDRQNNMRRHDMQRRQEQQQWEARQRAAQRMYENQNRWRQR